MTATRSGFATGLAAAEVAPGTVRVVQVDGRSVCVGHTEDDEWGAIDNICTHDGGVLACGRRRQGSGGRVHEKSRSGSRRRVPRLYRRLGRLVALATERQLLSRSRQ